MWLTLPFNRAKHFVHADLQEQRHTNREDNQMNMITIYSQIGDRVRNSDNEMGTVIEKKQNAHDSRHFMFRIRWDNENRDDSFRSRWC
jgi:hypothetical protein